MPEALPTPFDIIGPPPVPWSPDLVNWIVLFGALLLLAWIVKPRRIDPVEELDHAAILAELGTIAEGPVTDEAIERALLLASVLAPALRTSPPRAILEQGGGSIFTRAAAVLSEARYAPQRNDEELRNALRHLADAGGRVVS